MFYNGGVRYDETKNNTRFVKNNEKQLRIVCPFLTLDHVYTSTIAWHFSISNCNDVKILYANKN